MVLFYLVFCLFILFSGLTNCLFPSPLLVLLFLSLPLAKLPGIHPSVSPVYFSLCFSVLHLVSSLTLHLPFHSSILSLFFYININVPSLSHTSPMFSVFSSYFTTVEEIICTFSTCHALNAFISLAVSTLVFFNMLNILATPACIYMFFIF